MPRLLLASLLCSSFALACGGGSEATGQATGAVCDPRLTYAQDIEPFMHKYCVRCHAESVPLSQRHGAPGDHDFDTEQGVSDNAEHIASVAASGGSASNRSMPPDGAGAMPSDAERAVLGRYLACLAEGETSHAHEH